MSVIKSLVRVVYVLYHGFEFFPVQTVVHVNLLRRATLKVIMLTYKTIVTTKLEIGLSRNDRTASRAESVRSDGHFLGRTPGQFDVLVHTRIRVERTHKW